MLDVVSGQMVVHFESVKARITTLPRNALIEIAWPNWLVSRKSGAGAFSTVPGSRSGLAAAECSAAVIEPPPAELPLVGLVPQAARAAAAASAVATPAARASAAGRHVPFPTISHPATRPRRTPG